MSKPCVITARVLENRDIEADGGDHVVPWWSFTKTLLAAAALRLVADGRLSLDEPLAGRPYNLRQLLQHRAGVPCYGGLEAYHAAVDGGGEPWAEDELLQRTRADDLRFPPDGGWRYSNVGYLFVRRIIENATGAPLEAALTQLVLAPLGVKTARVAKQPLDLDGCAWLGELGYHPGWVYHGLVIGPARDALRLLHQILAGALLPAEFLARMTTPRWLDGVAPGRPWTRAGYGLGLMIGEMEGAGRAIGHSGSGPGSTNAVYHFPELSPACTVAAFAKSEKYGVAESALLSLAVGP